MIIECLGLTKCYRQNAVVDNLTVDVEAGEIFGFLGPNGAGKTTTVRILTTVISPDAGTAKVMGYDVRQEPMEVRKTFALLPQEGALNPVLSVEENIWLYLLLLGWDRSNARRQALEVMERMDLMEHKEKNPRELSGGLRRRVQVARTLATNAPILFLDEPTVGLDPQARRQTWKAIKAAQATGATVFMTTQSMQEAETLCDRVAFINHGKLLALDQINRLRQQFSTAQVRIELSGLASEALIDLEKKVPNVKIESGGNEGMGELALILSTERDVPNVLAQVYQHGGQVNMLTQELPRLEDIYLQLMSKE